MSDKPVSENYPDFVARTGQVNTPPGSYDTLKLWIREGFISNNSELLEIGCTTGFIANQLSRYTGAKTTGIDLSSVAIGKAREHSLSNEMVSFEVGDAGDLPYSDETFSHVVIGGHLPWVPYDVRKEHVQEAVRVLKPNGFLLTSLYHFVTEPPEKLVSDFNDAFNTQLSAKGDLESWDSLFRLPNLHLEFNQDYKVRPPSAKRLDDYVGEFDETLRPAWREKANLLAENGEHLGFFVRVYQKLSPDDPYIQTPRGGIYTWERI